MSLITFLGITLLILLGAMSPGPDFAIVSRNTLIGSRHSGIYTSLGIALAIYIHTNYCVWGLAVIIAHSTWLFNTIKYLGAAYLIYIGIKGLWPRSKSSLQTDQADTPETISTPKDMTMAGTELSRVSAEGGVQVGNFGDVPNVQRLIKRDRVVEEAAHVADLRDIPRLKRLVKGACTAEHLEHAGVRH